MFMNSEKKSLIVAYAVCAATNAQGAAVWMENKVSPQPGKYLTAVTNSLWLAGQANMVKGGATFMSKRHCHTVSVCLFCSMDSKGPVKTIAVLLSCSSLPSLRSQVRGSGGKTLWVQVWGSSGAAAHVGCGTELKACTKSWAWLCSWEWRALQPVLANCLALVSGQI